MTAREVALNVLIAVQQQGRVIEAAQQLDSQGRQSVRAILARTGKQQPLDFWEGACDVADGGTG